MAKLIDDWVPPPPLGTSSPSSSSSSSSPPSSATPSSSSSNRCPLLAADDSTTSASSTTTRPTDCARAPATAGLSPLRPEASQAADQKAGGIKDHSFMFDSATKASIFLETSALQANGTLPSGVEKRHLVRKVAHAIHLFPGPWRDFVHSEKVAQVLHGLKVERPVVAQSLYRLAPPQSAGVERHQDSVTLYTEPPSVVGLWLALEDADEGNGCVQVLPGSHKGALRERLVQRPASDCVGPDCPMTLEFIKLKADEEESESEFSPVVVKAGDLIVLHGTLEHLSRRGRDPNRSRESFQVHLVSGAARWPADNWLQYPKNMSFEEVKSPTT
eukprot:CAMPEP_0206534658 /NCGR_PEP_ID=MMETSP0325_2-20121206/5671_1 /ASSEMBLY_ACC=CAM_ASM_000347 /TAXON_ID=2866 /ORGANISM="Crypthecodinium cohnii, Strain Seligo" /LENGTH=329 /DNA_ID=CAMNT_0054031493 /DNA_START=416 /DNA_END=1401 /DNA_ORIENTATION=-